MLVPVTSPKFSFNRQKYLGNVLANSVRYEADGWFAGWWVHNFDMVTTGYFDVQPAGLGEPILQKLYVPSSLSDTYWYVKFRDVDLELKVIFETFESWIEGTGTVTRADNTDNVVIAGRTSGNKNFTTIVNAYDGTIISHTCDDPELEVSCSFQDGLFKYVLMKPYVLGTNMAWVRFGENVTFGGVSLEYDYTNGIHNWGGIFTYDGTNFQSINTEYTIASFQAINLGAVDEVFSVVVNVNGVFTIKIEKVSFTGIGMRDRFTRLENASSSRTGYVDSGTNRRDNVTWQGAAVNREFTDMYSSDQNNTPFARAICRWRMPIWLKYGLNISWQICDEILNADRTYVDITSGDPPVSTRYDYYMYTPCLMLNIPTGEIASVQDKINNTGDTRWDIYVNGAWTNSIDTLSSTIRIPLSSTKQYVSYPNRSPTLTFNVQLRCVNTNAGATYPVPAGYAYGTLAFNVTQATPLTREQLDAQYPVTGTSPNPCILYYQSSVTHTALTLGANSGNHIVLNSANFGDSALFPTSAGYQDTATLNCTFPLCVYGYTINRVLTTDVTQSKNGSPSVNSFSVEELSNAALNSRYWRLDSDGNTAASISKYALDVVEAYVASCSKDNSSGGSPLPPPNNGAVGFKLILGYNNATMFEFDKVAYHLDANSAQVNPNPSGNGYYPSWIANGAQSDFFVKYTDISVASASIGDQFVGSITYSQWITGGQSEITCAPDNPTNQTVVNELTGQLEVLTQPAVNVFTQNIRLWIDRVKANYLDIAYNVENQTAAFVQHYTTFTGVSQSLVVKYDQNTGMTTGLLTVVISRVTQIRQEFRRSLIVQKNGLMAGVSIIHSTSQQIDFTVGYGSIDRTGLYTNHPNVAEYLIETNSDNIKVHVTEVNRALVYYLPKGIWWTNKTLIYKRIVRVNDRTTVVFEYDGIEYSVTMGDDLKSELAFTTTDIRDGAIKDVYRVNTADIIMAIKQFWSNDVTVENHWWINNEYVLELSKFDLTLYKKSKDINGRYLLHDWWGDRWEVVSKGRRSLFFGNLDLYYGVSSALNTAPILFKLTNRGTYITLSYIKNVYTNDYSIGASWIEKDIPIQQISFGQPLNNSNTITSYMPLDINALLCTAKISSTVIGDDFLLGIALTRGLQQWTIRINIASNTLISITNGYGHVGHNGSLTGGQIPSLFCNHLGLTAAVMPLDAFKDDEGMPSPDNQIYGSGTTVWFVYSSIKGIVSHLTFENGNFVPQIMPLSNNYHCAAQTEAYQAAAMFDGLPTTLSLPAFIQQAGDDTSGATSVITNSVAAMLMPSFWFMNPFIVTAVGVTQAIQQAAYVIRNKLPTKSDDGKSDKDVVALRRVYSQDATLPIGKLSSIVMVILSALGTLGQAGESALSASASQNATTPDDTAGRKLGEFAFGAVTTAIAANLNTKGLVLAVKLKMEERLALSMFYSIDDGCQCYAGPGFVNHNFIGQCVAQGIASTRAKAERFGMFIPLKILSGLLNSAQLWIYKGISQGLLDTADSWETYQPIVQVLGTGSTLPVGPVLAAAMRVLALVTLTMQWICEWFAEDGIDQLYAAIGETGRGFSSGGFERSTSEPEGTHSYGNKPMSMFWPAFGMDVTVPRNFVTVETVQSKVLWERIQIDISGQLIQVKLWGNTRSAQNTGTVNAGWFEGGLGFSFPFGGNFWVPHTKIKASYTTEALPQGMAFVEGITKMLPDGDFKNLQVNCCDYTFPAPPIHDYKISSAMNGVGIQAANGEIISYSADDIKLMDGPASNIIELPGFFGLASSYTAIELKDIYDHDYLRPWAITPNCIALNISKTNSVHDSKAYHSFDGQFNRITSWKGGVGLDSATMVQQYCLQVNDHFKRSNITPPSEFFGLFNGPPSINMRTLNQDKIANQVMDLTRQKGLDINIPGEDRDLTRYSVAIHSETLSTLPAVVRMLAPYKLHVVEGITSLTTDVRNTQTKYKAPSSVDFNIYDKMFRATEEYICDLTLQDGIIAVQDKVPSAGLTYIGATTKEAFFYSEATRMYYSFQPGGDLNKKDVVNRFKKLTTGRWDFVNQEVVFKALFTDGILRNDVDGYGVIRMERDMNGEVYPPNETIYNERSDFKIFSMAGGLVYQGPKRCAVNRFITLDTMYDQIKRNKKRWLRLDREAWEKRREYGWQYVDFRTDAGGGVVPANSTVFGWTHNPWRAATAMLGIDEETDCKFEWELTFAWTDVMDKLFEQNEFISFNVAGETIGQGGTLLARPTHIFLYKELFKNGYYTMRYQSNNGIGNRERLYMWGDGLSALEDLALFTKDITKRRTQPLATSQVDVQELLEQ